jgi:YVTN family beta-propeller protein
MKISDLGRYALGICAAIAIPTGCGSQTPIGAPGAMPQMQPNRQLVAGAKGRQSSSSAEAPAMNLNLYVANYGNSTVTVYGKSSTKVLRTISKGISSPWRLVVGSAGYLYVANYNNTVTEYAPGKTSVLRTISQGVNTPLALAFDGSGNLYVANGGNNTVTVYAKGSTKVLRTISQGITNPIALAFDGSGNL